MSHSNRDKFVLLCVRSSFGAGCEELVTALLRGSAGYKYSLQQLVESSSLERPVVKRELLTLLHHDVVTATYDEEEDMVKYSLDLDVVHGHSLMTRHENRWFKTHGWVSVSILQLFQEHGVLTLRQVVDVCSSMLESQHGYARGSLVPEVKRVFHEMCVANVIIASRVNVATLEGIEAHLCKLHSGKVGGDDIVADEDVEEDSGEYEYDYDSEDEDEDEAEDVDMDDDDLGDQADANKKQKKEKTEDEESGDGMNKLKRKRRRRRRRRRDPEPHTQQFKKQRQQALDSALRDDSTSWRLNHPALFMAHRNEFIVEYVNKTVGEACSVIVKAMLACYPEESLYKPVEHGMGVQDIWEAVGHSSTNANMSLADVDKHLQVMEHSDVVIREGDTYTVLIDVLLVAAKQLLVQEFIVGRFKAVGGRVYRSLLHNMVRHEDLAELVGEDPAELNKTLLSMSRMGFIFLERMPSGAKLWCLRSAVLDGIVRDAYYFSWCHLKGKELQLEEERINVYANVLESSSETLIMQVAADAAREAAADADTNANGGMSFEAARHLLAETKRDCELSLESIARTVEHYEHLVSILQTRRR